MVDIPERTDDSANVIIYGVESEQIEEENDAYQDMRYELGERNEENVIFRQFSSFSQAFTPTERMSWMN